MPQFLKNLINLLKELRNEGASDDTLFFVVLCMIVFYIVFILTMAILIGFISDWFIYLYNFGDELENSIFG